MKVIDFEPIGRGKLLAKAKLLQPGPFGVIMFCAVIDVGKERPWIKPDSVKLPNGSYQRVLDFIDKDASQRWQDAAFRAIQGRLAIELQAGGRQSREGATDGYCPF